MSRIYLLDYENYFNRKCAPPEQNVLSYQQYELAYYDNVNFNPNDGVAADLIVNHYGTHPNYLLVVDEYPIVASRWYVIESQRTRAGQLRLVLRRDLVADFYDYVLDAPAMIERGRLSENDSYVFNDEGMRFNQIKTTEKLLKDETQTPWIVGYIANEQENQEEDVSITVNLPQSFDYSGSSTTDWDTTLAHYVSHYARSSANAQVTHSILARDPYTLIDSKFSYGGNTDYFVEKTDLSAVSVSLTWPAELDINTYMMGLKRAFDNQHTTLDNAAIAYSTPDDPAVANMRAAVGKIVKVGTDTYYRIELVEQDYTYEAAQINTSSNYFVAMRNFALNTPVYPGSTTNLFSAVANTTSFTFVITGKQYGLKLVPIYNQLNVTIPAARTVLDDAPYAMFAMPYGDVAIESGPVTALRLGGVDIATRISSAIAKTLTQAKLYDIQLLPYCPVRRAINKTTGGIELAQLTQNVDYALIRKTSDASSSTVGFMLWAESSNFSFDIANLQLLPHSKKVTNQCIMNRLCSPNYSSVYEFNIAKSGGLTKFSVDCSYKPYSPYIHLWPVGGTVNLYGADFDDPRGLICAGDFSMPATSNQWALYEINNKNYQNMFNRQIETMDLTHRIQRTESIVNAVVGTAQGITTGVGAGVLMGGGAAGGVAGGVLGGAASGIGGIVDVIHGQELRENERAQAFDMFRMGNENIQAMPDTLTKVSAFTPNNKIFPIYETYSATAQEIAAFEKYIEYRGMTVGRVDNISNFIWPSWEFVQASIIRFDDFAEDSHTAYEINNELMKGVYLKQ